MSNMQPIVAGAMLVQAVANADGDLSDDEAGATNEWLYYNVGISGARPYIDQVFETKREYLVKHGVDSYNQKLEEDAFDVLNSEPLEYRQMVICFARHVARADWSFDDAVGNISYEELDMLSRFCLELDVDINDVPFEPPSSSSDTSSGCFIATAAYGTPFAEEIDVLRNWRDDFLEASYPGRLFIKTYYSLSPPVADNISESEGKRKIVRTALGPIVKILKGKYSD